MLAPRPFIWPRAVFIMCPLGNDGSFDLASCSFGPFFAAGMSVVAVQYRNAIDAPAPAAVQDVLCAMSWVKKNAAKYNFDPNKVVTWGGSAGGHLALMAGYAPTSMVPPGCTDQPKVVAVIDMYGASDVAESLTFHGSMDFTHQWIGLDLPLPPDPAPAAAATPATPDSAPAAASAGPANPDGMPRARPQPPRWPDPTEAMLARAREVSPLTYIHPGLPPTFIINGDHDNTYNPTQSYKLKAALDAAHVPNEEDIVVVGGHGNFSRRKPGRHHPVDAVPPRQWRPAIVTRSRQRTGDAHNLLSSCHPHPPGWAAAA